MVNGYIGKILWVDLSKKTVNSEELNEKICRDYLGGYGIGAHILFNRQKPGVDPLGPENILGFITGILTGTAALGGSRFCNTGVSGERRAAFDAESSGCLRGELSNQNHNGGPPQSNACRESMNRSVSRQYV